MTLKETLEDFWKNGRVFNPCHINLWNQNSGWLIGEWGEFKLYLRKGRLVPLKRKRSKYHGATQPWLTPNALQSYRAHRAYYLDQVEKARKVLGLNA